jgi:hypothetical protein
MCHVWHGPETARCIAVCGMRQRRRHVACSVKNTSEGADNGGDRHGPHFLRAFGQTAHRRVRHPAERSAPVCAPTCDAVRVHVLLRCNARTSDPHLSFLSNGFVVTVVVGSTGEKLNPLSVVYNPPLVGLLEIGSVLRTGASNDIDWIRVPVREVESTLTPVAPNVVADIRHWTSVVVTHEAEPHVVGPMCTLAVGSAPSLPKFSPEMVTAVPPERGEFRGEAYDTTGAANRLSAA